MNEIILSLLDWPFLAFMLIIIFMKMYKEEVTQILGRGDIHITWNGKSIRLKDLSETIDKELMPLRDDLDQVQETIDSNYDKRSEVKTSDGISDAEQLTKIEATLRRSLNSKKYKWRKISTIARIAGISDAQCKDILENFSDVRVTKGKYGDEIAGLNYRTHQG